MCMQQILIYMTLLGKTVPHFHGDNADIQNVCNCRHMVTRFNFLFRKMNQLKMKSVKQKNQCSQLETQQKQLVLQVLF